VRLCLATHLGCRSISGLLYCVRSFNQRCALELVRECRQVFFDMGPNRAGGTVQGEADLFVERHVFSYST
jgi:hypothetical protein